MEKWKGRAVSPDANKNSEIPNVNHYVKKCSIDTYWHQLIYLTVLNFEEVSAILFQNGFSVSRPT